MAGLISLHGVKYTKSLCKTIRFPVGKINEDEFVFHHIAFSTKTISLVNNVLYYYRTRLNSIMNRRFGPERLDAIEARLDRLRFLDNKIDSKSFNAFIPHFSFDYAYALSVLNLDSNIVSPRINSINNQINLLMIPSSSLSDYPGLGSG